MATWGVGLMLVFSAGPVWASLERVLGRPIPGLRNSPAVKRNRVYVAVPMVMGVVWLVATAACHGASDGCGGSSVALGMALAALAGLGCVRAVGVL